MKKDNTDRKKVIIFLLGFVIAGVLIFVINNRIIDPMLEKQKRQAKIEEEKEIKRYEKEIKERNKLVEDFMKERCKAIQEKLQEDGFTGFEVSYGEDTIQEDKERAYYENGKEYKEYSRLSDKKYEFCDKKGNYPYCYRIDLEKDSIRDIWDEYPGEKDFMEYIIRIRKSFNDVLKEKTKLPYKKGKNIIITATTVPDEFYDAEFVIQQKDAYYSSSNWGISKSKEGTWQLWSGYDRVYPEKEHDEYLEEEDKLEDKELAEWKKNYEKKRKLRDGYKYRHRHVNKYKNRYRNNYSDPYDVEDYDNPDEFADEWAGEFGDGDYDYGYKGAYEYWEDEHE